MSELPLELTKKADLVARLNSHVERLDEIHAGTRAPFEDVDEEFAWLRLMRDDLYNASVILKAMDRLGLLPDKDYNAHQ